LAYSRLEVEGLGLVGVIAGTSFQFFPGGCKILNDFLGGEAGAKYEEKKIVCKNTKESIFVKIRGGMPPFPPCPPK